MLLFVFLISYYKVKVTGQQESFPIHTTKSNLPCNSLNMLRMPIWVDIGWRSMGETGVSRLSQGLIFRPVN